MSAWQVPVASAAGAASKAIPWRSNGQLRLTVLTKAAFDFEPNGSMKLSASPVDEIAEGDVPAGEDPSGSVRNASDLVPFKPRVDATCWGYAHAPGGIPIPRLQARIAIANQTGITFDKVIDVIGDRTLANPNPIPFLKMPLIFERAYGGPEFAANPVGVGFGARANILPNLLYPQGWNRDTEPAVFAPIPASWSRRSRLLGNQALNFSGESVVTIPEQLDVAYFQSAPEDQRLASLEGNEWLLFENLHPKHPRLTTRLPDIAGMVMAFGFQGADKQIPLRLDSLVIDAEREKCIVTCRGSIPIPNEAALDDLRLAAGIGWGGQTIDWSDAKKKALEPSNAPVGTAVLDPNATVKFSSPYEIAKPGATDTANARPAMAIPGAPFAAAATSAFVVAQPSPAGELTLIGGDLPMDLDASMPFPKAAPTAETTGTLSSGPASSGLPGAPFAIGGAQPQPTASVAPAGTITLPLGDDSFFPPDFDALLQARAAAAPIAASALAVNAAPELDPELVVAALSPAIEVEPAKKPNPAWSWAQPQTPADSPPRQAVPTPASAAMRPTEPSPRALIYGGFTKK